MEHHLPKNDSQAQKLVVPDATPRPWHSAARWVYDVKITEIAGCSQRRNRGESEANARLIVRAVNSFDALVAFIERYISETNCICRFAGIQEFMGTDLPCTKCEAQKLLKLAKGE